MKALVRLFKREQFELPEAVIELFQEVGTEELEVSDDLIDKLLNDEDLANSWILSIASSYRDRADLITVTIRHNHHEFTIANYTREKPANYYMIAPKLAKLHRILFIPASLSTSEDATYSRELTLKVGEVSNVSVYTPPDNYFVYESIIIPKTDGVLLFEHECGSTAIDLSEIRNLLASSTRSSTSKSKARKSRKSAKKKRRKSSRKKRVASAK